ncbi:T9SS type A sorting domain-containing protein [Lacinutrix chionoecetis]
MKKELPIQTPQALRLRNLLILFALCFSLQGFAIETESSEDTYCGHITGFEFSNGNSSTPITNNGTYTIGDLPNNFFVNVLVSGYTQSASIRVKNVNTGQYVTITENYLPYTFPGGNGAWNYGPGTYQVKSKVYKYNSCASYSCDTEYITFTLTNTPPCGQIDGLAFSNGTNTVNITNGGSYDLATLPYNFYVDVLVSGMTESAYNKVKNLNTGQVYTNGENVLPYTYPSGNAAWNLGTGTFQFYSEIFKYDNCAGTKCDHICYTFTIYEQNCGDIAELQFSNGSDTPTTIVDGGSYDINSLPSNFYIDAIVNGQSESVRFEVENLDTNEEYSIIENYIPYTFPAGNGAWYLGTGTFEVKTSLYTGNYCNNTLCDQETITFTLTDTVDPCLAASGSITLDQQILIYNGVDPVVVNITLNGDSTIPTGYEIAYLISEANVTGELEILEWTTTGSSFDFTSLGIFRVHVLVFDDETLDLNSIQLGQTTATDVENTIAANNICASLEEVGVAVEVIPGGPDQKSSQPIKTQVTSSNDEPEVDNVIEVAAVDTYKAIPSTDNNVDIKLYPNPAVNNLNVELLLLDAEVMNYNMIDLNGRHVLKGSFDNSTLGKTKVDVSNLSNGLYILTFKSNFRTFSKKIQVNN